MIALKQSTAITLKFGPFVDEDDGKTAETGLTITQGDIRLSKNGDNIAQKNTAGTASHDELGFYDVALDATDTDTLGRLMVAVHESGALPVFQYFMVLPANVWDSMYGSDKLYVDVNEVSGDSIAAQRLDALALAMVPHTQLLQAGSTTTTLVLGSTASSIDDFYKGATVCLLDGVAVGQMRRITGYVGSTKTATLDTALLTSAPATSDPYTIIQGYHGEGAGGASASEVADAVWDEAKSGHVAGGSMGEEVQAHATPAEVATELGTYDGPTKAEMDTGHGLLATGAKQDTIDTVVDAVKAVTDVLPNAGALSDLATILTDTGTTLPAEHAALSGEHGALATEAKQDIMDTVVDAIKAITDVLPNAGALNDLALILADTDELQVDDVPGLIAGLNDPTAVAIANAVLRQPTSSVETSWTEDHRTLYGVIAALMHKAERDGGDNNIILYKSDDTTVLVTIPITKDSGLDPIQTVDPPA